VSRGLQAARSKIAENIVAALNDMMGPSGLTPPQIGREQRNAESRLGQGEEGKICGLDQNSTELRPLKGGALS